MGSWIKNLIFGVIGFCVVFIGLMQVNTALLNQYSMQPEGNYSELYVQMNKSIASTNEMASNFNEAQNTGTLSEFYLFSKQIYQSIKMMMSMPSIVIDILAIFAGQLGIPGWIIGAFIGLLIACLALFIFAVVTKSQY